MPMSDELEKCLVLNTIAAARSLLRRYDAELKPYGVTVQQFSLLAAVRFHPDEAVATIAQRIALDRTSLTRSLNLLEKMDLVRRVRPDRGNVRLCELTGAGNALLDRLLPEWRRSRGVAMSGLSMEDAATYLRIAKRLTKV